MNTMPLNKDDRMRGGLWGMFVGDALAMPVHWYYNIAALWQDFGQIKITRPLKRTILTRSWLLLTQAKLDAERKKVTLLEALYLRAKTPLGSSQSPLSSRNASRRKYA